MSNQLGRRSEGTEFVWNSNDWIVAYDYNEVVSRMVPLDPDRTPFESVVKKEAEAEVGSAGKNPPWEVQCLDRLPDCNRIVKPFHVSYNGVYENGYHTYNLIFEEYKLGDLLDWRSKNFSTKNSKVVPEAHLWRFLVHMTQALAVVHNQLGSSQKHRGTLIHSDIKPENVLVADNGGAYPSFKLHDFDFAKVVFGREHRRGPAFSGTFIWQPPEGPFTRTTSADIWAVGALLHYLAFDEYLVAAMRPNWMDYLDKEDKKRVAELRCKYSSELKTYEALGPRIVSPINLGEASRIAKVDEPSLPPRYTPKYSDRLNYWMMECLEFDPMERVTVSRLMEEMVPEARATLMDLDGEQALVDFELLFD